MGAYRQQALIEAPVADVWREVGNPNRYPLWAGDTAEVTDLDEVKVGAHYRQKSRTPLGTPETEFVIEALDDMHEIEVRCLTSGYYLHWVLTEAGDDTFAEVEIGMDPKHIRYRAMDVALGKRWYRGAVERTLDGLRKILR